MSYRNAALKMSDTHPKKKFPWEARIQYFLTDLANRMFSFKSGESRENFLAAYEEPTISNEEQLNAFKIPPEFEVEVEEQLYGQLSSQKIAKKTLRRTSQFFIKKEDKTSLSDNNSPANNP